MKLPWPEISSSCRPGETIRDVLDYLAWIGLDMAQSGHLIGPNREAWRQRVQRAYRALFLPPVSGHGDPYPPDVPPARNPGTWPDIPSGGVPGMTVRHQLKVMRLLTLDLRDHPWPHGRAPEFVEWDKRLGGAREALDLGDGIKPPEEARTCASEEVLAEAKAQDDARRRLIRKRERALKRIQSQARPKKKKAAPKKKKPAAKKKKG